MYRIYQIANNDTLQSIASRFNTTIERIKELNGIKGDVVLKTGGFIIVPMEQQSGYLQKYIVKKGDNIYAIARDNNVDYEMLLELNGLDKNDYIYPEQEIILPKDGVKLYKTKEGDSIKKIEEKTGVSINEIQTPSGELYLQNNQIIMY